MSIGPVEDARLVELVLQRVDDRKAEAPLRHPLPRYRYAYREQGPLAEWA
jgi:hypothetical protein